MLSRTEKSVSAATKPLDFVSSEREEVEARTPWSEQRESRSRTDRVLRMVLLHRALGL